jgi:hypothetical protein
MTNWMNVAPTITAYGRDDANAGGIIGLLKSGRSVRISATGGTFNGIDPQAGIVKTTTINPQHTWINNGTVTGNTSVGGIIGHYLCWDDSNPAEKNRTVLDKTSARFSDILTDSTTQIINNKTVAGRLDVGGFFGTFDSFNSGFVNLTNLQSVE